MLGNLSCGDFVLGKSIGDILFNGMSSLSHCSVAWRQAYGDFLFFTPFRAVRVICLSVDFGLPIVIIWRCHKPQSPKIEFNKWV